MGVIEGLPVFLKESASAKTPRCVMLARNTARLRLWLSAEDKSSVTPAPRNFRQPRTSQTM
ncbi:hypothetical protein, partial [Mesorhizobium sp.]|uniref:hypothetical protein n=1 Tax=Mesorhizobium sp. TaxID=1871066 RepID=UPI0025BC5B2F